MEFTNFLINTVRTISVGGSVELWNKYFQSAEHYTANGEFVLEPMTYNGEVFDVPVYYGRSPGYDAIASTGFVFRDLIPVIILNEDGSVPEKIAPVANPDEVELTGGATRFTFAHLLANDYGASINLAYNLVVQSLNSNVAVEHGYFDTEDMEINLYQAGQQPFIGTLDLRYKVLDVFDDASNWATVRVDWLGDNTSRDNIEGTAVGDLIDFELSAANVVVHALGGDDTVRGSQGNDTLNGDEGADIIGGKNGNDIINGGIGTDHLFGDKGNDTIDGGEDNDLIYGGEGNDTLRGGAGNDNVFGDSGDDRLGGKTGNDALRGGSGNDWIWGDEGNDVLYGDAGSDTLHGGAGNDVLTGGLGADILTGNAGVDTFVFLRGEAQGDVVLDFEGATVFGGDKLEFRGYGAGAALQHLADDTWQIDGAGVSETIRIAGITSLSNGDYYFV